MRCRLNLWIRSQRNANLEAAGFRRVCLLELPLLMSDQHGPGHFTLSYTRFPCSPDVFLNESVIIYGWPEGSRGEER
jgi:hypothetical protein